MTLKNAIMTMGPAEAAKRPFMCGYVYKDTEGLTDGEIETGKFRLAFVSRTGELTKIDIQGLNTDTDTVNVMVDNEFIANIYEDNWEISVRADLEIARSGVRRW